MASEKYRKAVKKVMERTRAMPDDEFLELIRSQDGELGQFVSGRIEIINFHNPNDQPLKPFNGMGYK